MLLKDCSLRACLLLTMAFSLINAVTQYFECMRHLLRSGSRWSQCRIWFILPAHNMASYCTSLSFINVSKYLDVEIGILPFCPSWWWWQITSNMSCFWLFPYDWWWLLAWQRRNDVTQSNKPGITKISCLLHSRWHNRTELLLSVSGRL